jgi:menaquinone-dependent protoporphyrinogen oxidase
MVLVAYVTRYGSTKETAEEVATELRKQGLAVEVRPAREVQSLEGYRAVVIGTALYIGHWLKDTDRFLAEHREALASRPVAIFALGPTWGKPEDADWQECRTVLEKEPAKAPWLRPVAVELFGGKYDPARLRFLDKLISLLPGSPLYKKPASDVRNWTAIRAWADDLAAKLQPAVV